jgi:hypothetical protein
MARLTPNEYTAIMQAAQQQLAQGNPQLAMWLDQVRLLGTVNLTDPQTQQAKSFLVATNLLTQDRADIILAP